MTVPWNLESILRRCVHVETIVFLQVEVFARKQTTTFTWEK